MTGKLSPRVGEARDTAVSHYVFEAPVRLWHWLTVACMLVLMVTGYFIGRPLPSVSGEATYLFYMGYIRLIHFAAAMIFTVLLLGEFIGPVSATATRESCLSSRSGVAVGGKALSPWSAGICFWRKNRGATSDITLSRRPRCSAISCCRYL